MIYRTKSRYHRTVSRRTLVKIPHFLHKITQYITRRYITVFYNQYAITTIFQLSLFVIDTETVKHILELDLIISRQSLCAIQRILIRRNLLLPQQFKNQREKIHSVSHWFYRIIKCSVLFFRHIQCTINLTCPYHILRK